MRPEFELNHLKYFYFTVLEGSVASAAERLHVQQPVVSKMLSTLEEGFQQSLFRKVGRRKVMTDFGQLVYRHCQNIFQELERLDAVRLQDTRLSGPLNFGCNEVIAGQGLAKSLQELHKKFPDLHPNVYSSTASHLIDMIAQRKLEFGLFFHLPSLPSSLEIVHKIPMRFHLVVKKSCKKNVKVIESFIGSREIDDNSTHRFPTLERMKQDYPKAKIVLSSNNLSFHKQLVMEGLGSSILPSFLIVPDLKRDVLHDVYPKEKFIFDLKIVTSKAQSLSTAAERLLENISHNFS
jgi:DNA-binding transcriptional LysR family regulator